MENPTLETILLDFDHERIVAGKWDGHDLALESIPQTHSAFLPEFAGFCERLITRVSPTTPFELVVRVRPYARAGVVDSKEFTARMKSCGAQSVRPIGEHIAEDAGIAAAKYFANQRGLAEIISVEISKERLYIAWVKRGGEIGAHERIEAEQGCELSVTVMKESIARFLKTIPGPTAQGGAAEISFVVFGLLGRDLARSLKQVAQRGSILVPDWPETFSTVGLLLADLVLEFREDITAQSFDIAVLRSMFARLMDKSCEAVTRAGYDLDDAISHRSVLLAGANRADPIEMSCEQMEEKMIVSQFVEPVVLAARLQTIITTKKPELPGYQISINAE